MKFIFYTDTHITGKNPGSRKDIFTEALFRKIEWVGKYARNIGATAILHGGDLFHTPDISNSLVSSAIALFKKSFRDIPHIVIQGNHDIYGNNPSTIPKTAFGLMEAAGVIWNVDGTSTTFLSNDVAVHVCGTGSFYSIDEHISNHICRYVPEDSFQSKDITIHLLHGAVYDGSSEGSLFNYYGCADLDVPENTADIILTGHIHNGYPPYRGKSGRLFANPGALGRLSVAASDINLTVKIAVITVDDITGEYGIDYVGLPSDIAFPPEEVLDIERAIAEKESQKKFGEFVGTMQKISVDAHMRRGHNVYETLRIMSREENLSRDIVDMTISQLERAEEEVKGG